MYEIETINLKKFKKKIKKISKKPIFWLVILLIVVLAIFSSSVEKVDIFSGIKNYFKETSTPVSTDSPYIPQTSQEQAVINTVKEASPAVVSIIISKDIPIMEEYYYSPFPDFPGIEVPGYRQKGTEKKEIGGGTGFIVSSDGLVLTNKHVVLDEKADYTVFTNDGKKYTGKVLAKDPVQDFAIIKITSSTPFPIVRLGDSEDLQIGQSVIAIGNALGEYRNTVSVGVISGLGRTISASDSDSFTETLEDIIQTDAAINPGNSGGPLLNLRGEVIGINTAVAQDAQSISFAIPINYGKKDIQQVATIGKIVYPFIGIRYVIINDDIKEKDNLSVNYGAWIKKGDSGQPAITKDSPADKAGLKDGDIVLEINRQKITQEHTLSEIIVKHNPGDTVTLKVLRDGKEMTIPVTLSERPQ